jgi:hypothetical protein
MNTQSRLIFGLGWAGLALAAGLIVVPGGSAQQASQCQSLSGQARVSQVLSLFGSPTTG